MATSSIGQVIRLDEVSAKRIIKASEEVDANPPAPPRQRTPWANLDELVSSCDRRNPNVK
jgi:hypothetical protein